MANQRSCGFLTASLITTFRDSISRWFLPRLGYIEVECHALGEFFKENILHMPFYSVPGPRRIPGGREWRRLLCSSCTTRLFLNFALQQQYRPLHFSGASILWSISKSRRAKIDTQQAHQMAPFSSQTCQICSTPCRSPDANDNDDDEVVDYEQ